MMIPESDIGAITVLITNARLCQHCIARKTGVPIDQVPPILETLAGALRLRTGLHPCDACLAQKTTFSLATNGHP